MADRHYRFVTVALNEELHPYVWLGQISVNTRMREISEMVRIRANLNGMQNVALGYRRPGGIVYLPAMKTLAVAITAIIRVSS